MGWLRKKFRQLDRRVRKIFGKNAWLKVAAIIGGVYMGTGGFGGTPISGKPWFSTGSGSSAVSGKFATFGKNLWDGVKKIFWTPKAGSTPGAPTWAGRVAGNVAGRVVSSAIMNEAFPEELRGQQAGWAPQEGRGIGDLGVTAAGSGNEVASYMDAYRNFDFGPDSPTTYMNSFGPNRTVLPLESQLSPRRRRTSPYVA